MKNETIIIGIVAGIVSTAVVAVWNEHMLKKKNMDDLHQSIENSKYLCSRVLKKMES